MSLANYQRKYSNCWKPIISGILIVKDYSPKSAINIFFNDQIYCPRHLSFSAILCLSHSLSFSVSPLSCSLPTPFDSVYKPCRALSCYQLINIFRKELFAFQRLHLHETIPGVKRHLVTTLCTPKNWKLPCQPKLDVKPILLIDLEAPFRGFIEQVVPKILVLRQGPIFLCKVRLKFSIQYYSMAHGWEG